MRRSFVLAACLLACLSATPHAAQTPALPPACGPIEDLRFVCGPPGPEDLVAVPRTPWLVSSAMAGDGGIYVIDTTMGTSSKVFPTATSADRLDATTYASCPGPLQGADRTSFVTHGLYLKAGGRSVHTLYAVHHGGRESIEVFTIDAGATPPAVTWIGCVVAPDPIGLNAVVALPDGGFAATNFDPRPPSGVPAPGVSAKVLSGDRNGEVWEWHPKTGWAKVPGSEASGANGLELSADGKWYYVAQWGNRSFMRLSRGRTPVERKEIPVGFRVDNLRWSRDRRTLLVAGQDRALAELPQGAGPVTQVSIIGRIDPRAMTYQALVKQPLAPGLFAATVAIEVDREYWTGSFRGDRITRYPIPAVSAAGQASRAKALPDPPGAVRPARVSSPRLAPLAESQWTDVHRTVAAKYAVDGRPGNALRTLLHIPALADSFLSFPAYLTRDSTLSPRHRAILILRTAWLLNSDYIWSEHVPTARTAGLTPGELRRVAEGPDAKGWSPFEATLLRVADQLFRNSFVNAADYKALTAEYDQHHTIDAVMTVTDFLTVGLIYNALGIQPDAWNPDRMPADVRYRVAVPTREAPLAAPRVEPVPGTGLAIARTFARHPALAAARKELGYINQQMKLDARTRELVILRIGWNCQSAYEWAQHVGSFGKGREMGLPIENIARGPAAPGWNAAEQALLTATDELYRDSSISDRTWSNLSSQLDMVTILNAIASVAQYRQVSVALNTFGVPGEPGDEPLPAIGSN